MARGELLSRVIGLGINASVPVTTELHPSVGEGASLSVQLVLECAC